LRGHARECIEPRDEQSRRPFGTSQFGHGSNLRDRIGRSSIGPVRCQARDWAEAAAA
jgi:hypothetical protein